MYVFCFGNRHLHILPGRVRVTLRPFARHQKIKYNSRAIALSPNCHKEQLSSKNLFSDVFAFGRVILFAYSRPKLDLPFQIILGKKINETPFPLSRIFNTHKSKQRCAYRFVGNLQVLVGGHGKLTVQTPSIRCRKEKTHSNECVFLLETGIYISSQAVSSQVLSAQLSLTSVFGMRTGGTSASLTPVMDEGRCAFALRTFTTA